MPKDVQEKCIALIGDPHLPGRNLSLKEKVIRDINSWVDVDLVVCTGDLCSTFGTEKEFRFAANYFAKLSKPFFTLIGNHDNYYSDSGYVQGTELERAEKIRRYLRIFPDQKLYFSKEFAGYRLIFLAVDAIDSPYFSSISQKQLDWLEKELEKFPQQKTVVFCHAPIWTSEVIKLFPQAINYIAQPEEKLKVIVKKNAQIQLWVSGHVHFGMKKELINHPFNFYENQVVNILNCDLDGYSVLDLNIHPEFHDRIWTRKLFLNEKGFRCTVFDHNDGVELPELEMKGNF